MSHADELARILAYPFSDGQLETNAIYEACYVREFGSQPASAAADATDLTSAFEAANLSREGWEHGWTTLQYVPQDGRVVACKGSVTRAFWPGQYKTHAGPGVLPRKDGALSVAVPAASAELQPSFFFVFGETVSDVEETESLIRFYWNLRAEGAAPLIEALTRRLNRYQVPFRFKCLTRPAAFYRRDAAVLYVNRRFYPITALLVEEVYQEVAGWLEPCTPLFTRTLAPGLGFAESPATGGSFGMHRSALLAAALKAVRMRGCSAAQEQLDELARQFDSAGLSLELAWLNASSHPDAYRYPFAS